MLYVIQHGYNGVPRVEPEKIVYCVIMLEDLASNDIDCIFTNGHALNEFSSFYTKDKLPQIDEFVHYKDVFAIRWDWDGDRDLKRRKEAELLVKNDLPASFIRGYAVYNENAKRILTELGIENGSIWVRPDYYF